MHPENLKYSTTHEWVKVQGQHAMVGITDHAQSELGDIVYVELPQVGTKLSKGSIFGTVESVKTVSDLASPVSGEVIEVNNELPNTPELINESPYTLGWMIQVNMNNPDEVQSLMSSEEYENFIMER